MDFKDKLKKLTDPVHDRINNNPFVSRLMSAGNTDLQNYQFFCFQQAWLCHNLDTLVEKIALTPALNSKNLVETLRSTNSKLHHQASNTNTRHLDDLLVTHQITPLNEPSFWGMAYVVLGSLNGFTMITKLLRNKKNSYLLSTDTAIDRFNTLGLWQNFVKTLNQVDDKNQTHDLAGAFAIKCFESYENSFSEFEPLLTDQTFDAKSRDEKPLSIY